MKSDLVPLESTVEPAQAIVPEPEFLVRLDPWPAVFFGNLIDLFRPNLDRSFSPSHQPVPFWPDVFVPSQLPWNRFALSVLSHVVVIAALWGSVRLWPQKPEVLVSPILNRADVIYYTPSEYLPPLDTGGARVSLPQKGEPEYAPQLIISVPPEADNRTQTIVTPSDLKLNHDVPLPNIVAWSQIQPQPSVPLASTAAAANLKLPALPVAPIAPAPETIPATATSYRTPALSQAVVAPLPDVNGASSARTMQGPQAAVVEPAPQVDTTSVRRLGDINIGHAEVVTPAPELPVAEQYALSGRPRSGMGNARSAAVPPAPTIAGGASSNQGGRLIALGIHPAAIRAPSELAAGNRRGTFSATPEGRTGAQGTSDISTNTNDHGGSGSGLGKSSNGIPPGLSVGAPPNDSPRSTIAGPGTGNGTGDGAVLGRSSENSPLIADAKAPRVAATTPRPALEVSEDKATDVDHWIFGDRKFYSMTLNMPNLNSAGGSWVIRFAELSGTQSKGELTAPVATQKVDPAYPLELMRRNVQGTVTLYAVIRNDGSVSDVRVLRGVDDRLDQYARAALAGWHFRPATKNGNAVDLDAVVMIPFKPVRGKSSF
jgi:TonB family protein